MSWPDLPALIGTKKPPSVNKPKVRSETRSVDAKKATRAKALAAAKAYEEARRRKAETNDEAKIAKIPGEAKIDYEARKARVKLAS